MAANKKKVFRGDTLVIESTDVEGKCYQTPLFFIQKAQSIYIRVPAASPKVQRVQCNDKIKVASADVNGNCQGEWVTMSATVHDENEFPWLFRETIRKYGLKPVVGAVRNSLKRRFRRKPYCVIKLQMESANDARK